MKVDDSTCESSTVINTNNLDKNNFFKYWSDGGARGKTGSTTLINNCAVNTKNRQTNNKILLLAETNFPVNNE